MYANLWIHLIGVSSQPSCYAKIRIKPIDAAIYQILSVLIIGLYKRSHCVSFVLKVDFVCQKIFPVVEDFLILLLVRQLSGLSRKLNQPRSYGVRSIPVRFDYRMSNCDHRVYWFTD